mmetsp:Transcript_37851/g.121437  ORF Transcript_37851/g.121437 Transcript_37851/m.121437 type:complete len:228 (+) Transcript_37851:322-1005(+)
MVFLKRRTSASVRSEAAVMWSISASSMALRSSVVRKRREARGRSNLARSFARRKSWTSLGVCCFFVGFWMDDWAWRMAALAWRTRSTALVIFESRTARRHQSSMLSFGWQRFRGGCDADRGRASSSFGFWGCWGDGGSVGGSDGDRAVTLARLFFFFRRGDDRGAAARRTPATGAWPAGPGSRRSRSPARNPSTRPTPAARFRRRLRKRPRRERRPPPPEETPGRRR